MDIKICHATTTWAALICLWIIENFANLLRCSTADNPKYFCKIFAKTAQICKLSHENFQKPSYKRYKNETLSIVSEVKWEMMKMRFLGNCLIRWVRSWQEDRNRVMEYSLVFQIGSTKYEQTRVWADYRFYLAAHTWLLLVKFWETCSSLGIFQER